MKITRGEKGYHVVEVAELTKDLRLEGWRECLTSTPPTPSTEQDGTGFFQPVYNYNEELDIFSQEWEWMQDETMIVDRINELKDKLSETDYIIVKTYEARLVGEEEPYTEDFLQSIATQRNKQRIGIRYLLSLLPAETQQRMAISV